MKKLLLILSIALLSITNLYAQSGTSVSIEEKITALYIAYFQRAADYDGLIFWKNRVKETKNEKEKDNILKEISKDFSHQPIFINTYSNMNNITFVKSIYKNILGEAGDKSGIIFWTNLLDRGVSRSDMVADFIDTSITKIISKENFPNLNYKELSDANKRKNIIKNKIDIALYFTNSLKKYTNIINIEDIEKDLAYLASKKVLLSLYSNPLDKNIVINFIDNAMKSDNPIEFILNDNFITISGIINYVKPRLNLNHIGFSSNLTTTNPAKQIVLKLIDDNAREISTTTTNDKGEYKFFYIPKDIKVKVRIYSIMKNEQPRIGSWDVKVVDNTNNSAVYAIDGKLISTKDSDNIRNLKIPLRSKKSAPFSILDDIYKSMKKILDINQTNFPPLKINWSQYNTPSDGSVSDGQIITSFFDGEDSIYLLGDAYSDADEFDTHVIIHEWGHYFEKNFSRADNIGGAHGDGDRLDIRVAFSEGFGNAWSAIVTDNPIYTDTSSDGGWFMNIEKDTTIDAGWWSESSIQKIIYDLYDDKSEPHDKIELGLKPIYDVLTTNQKSTKAFTSIFPFITYLKDKNPLFISQIDELLSDEDINSITDDIYGEEHHNLYSNLGDEVCTYSTYGYSNKLLNHKYIRFTIDAQHSYNISVEQSNGDNADPDFTLYSVEPFVLKKSVNSSISWIEKSKIFLRAGDYILDISDYNNINEACFHIAIE